MTYTPDDAVPMPDDLSQLTPAQLADHHTAVVLYQAGIARGHIQRGDNMAAATAFVDSTAAFTVAFLARAFQEADPESAAEAAAALGEAFVVGNVSEIAGEWAHAAGINAGALHEAGHKAAKEVTRCAAIEQFLEDESARSYSQGYEDMREQAMRAASNAPGTPYTPTEAIRNLPFGGDGGTPTVDLGPTHADRPGNLAPCGVSTWDVPASSDLAEVDCVECLRALAQMHGAEHPGAGAELPGSDADYDAGFSDGLRMGDARGGGRLSALADSDGEGPETRPSRSRMTEESDG